MIKLHTFENISFSQAKAMIQQNIDIHDFIEKVENQPEWLESMGAITDFVEIGAITQGGCASGAYMPAVTYHTAMETMAKYGDEITEYVEEIMCEQPSGLSWKGLAVYYCSVAVELWASQFEEVISILQEDNLY